MKLSLVIEGGGLRGAFAVGALAELARVLPVPVHQVYATSSGAPNAAYFAAGQIEDGVRIWQQRTHGAQLVDYRNFVGTRPVMKIDELVSVFRDEIKLDPAAIERSPIDLHIALTEVDSGQGALVQATRDNIFDLLAAAMAIPVAYGKVVPVAGGRYIDGGFRAPVAIREALAAGADKVIVVLTKPRGHRRKQRRVSEWLQCRSYPGLPNTHDAIRSKWRHYNATMDSLDALEAAGSVALVRPPGELPVGRLSRSRSRILSAIEIGRQTVRDRAAALAEYLER
ncbi:patatin-like phospholipase family protein [Pseudenhygromyxa sp. WMMC2535]|uniref:patatin-like phospholipase family protein n=1 Tax=Pseudenhygromyxa sp. WMMC2535 TaxID=2712867 RepID=UPI0015579561|nr:patatin-like phospholipase family protein [Pseudenhygromyxa sp. WMMC2535]NVB43032.1 patatin-like phospholipase family protein [Pseudenhygromyxa sp. WMMC2535]